jgi:CheY-like chemotaxis protein
MRLEELTPAHVRRAVAIYTALAWPGAGFPRPRLSVADLEGPKTLEELLRRFDAPRRTEPKSSRRYTLRLGNTRYPFMKFVLQEYLVQGEFFFSVDTHDDLDVRPEDPDFASWQELKRFNADLKRRIEAAWAAEGLPTNTELRVLAEGLARVEREARKAARILVVDDETEVCRGLGALLEGRGYQVELAYDGTQVLARLAREPLPDLVLLDYSMPELDGEAVLGAIRSDPRLARLPVLLATASAIDLERMKSATGLLLKPYEREVLFAMLAQLLEARNAR